MPTPYWLIRFYCVTVGRTSTDGRPLQITCGKIRILQHRYIRVRSRHAKTPECWIIDFQLNSINSYNCCPMINCLQMYMICLNIWPKLSTNVASSWNSRLQHSWVSARLVWIPGLNCLLSRLPVSNWRKF